MKKSVLKVLSLVCALLMLSLAVVSCGGGNGGSGYAFKVGDVTLKIGMSADVVSKLGAPLNKNVTAACGGIPGEDIVYAFSGANMNCFGTEQDGNKLTITCYAPSNTPLTVHALCNGQEASQGLNLIGY